MRKQSFILPPDIKRRLPKILRRLGDLVKGNIISTNQGEVSPALRVVSTDIRFTKPSNYNRKIVKPTYRRDLTGVPSVEFVFADKALVKAVDLGIGLRLDGVGFKLAMTLEDEPRMYAGFGKKPYVAIADMEDLRGRVRMLFARALTKNYKGLETTLEVNPDLAVAYFEAVKTDPEIQAEDFGDEDGIEDASVPGDLATIPESWVKFFEKTLGRSYVLTTTQLPPLRVKVVSLVGNILTVEALQDFSSKTAGKAGDRHSIDLSQAPLDMDADKVFNAVMQAAINKLYQVHGRTKIRGIAMDSGVNTHPADAGVDFTTKPVVVQTPVPTPTPILAPVTPRVEETSSTPNRFDLAFLKKIEKDRRYQSFASTFNAAQSDVVFGPLYDRYSLEGNNLTLTLQPSNNGIGIEVEPFTVEIRIYKSGPNLTVIMTDSVGRERFEQNLGDSKDPKDIDWARIGVMVSKLPLVISSYAEMSESAAFRTLEAVLFQIDRSKTGERIHGHREDLLTTPKVAVSKEQKIGNVLKITITAKVGSDSYDLPMEFEYDSSDKLFLISFGKYNKVRFAPKNARNARTWLTNNIYRGVEEYFVEAIPEVALSNMIQVVNKVSIRDLVERISSVMWSKYDLQLQVVRTEWLQKSELNNLVLVSTEDPKTNLEVFFKMMSEDEAIFNLRWDSQSQASVQRFPITGISSPRGPSWYEIAEAFVNNSADYLSSIQPASNWTGAFWEIGAGPADIAGDIFSDIVYKLTQDYPAGNLDWTEEKSPDDSERLITPLEALPIKLERSNGTINLSPSKFAYKITATQGQSPQVVTVTSRQSRNSLSVKNPREHGEEVDNLLIKLVREDLTAAIRLGGEYAAGANRTASLLRKALGTSGKGVKVAHNLYYRITDKLDDKGIRYQESSKAGSKVLSFDGHVIVIAPDNRNWTLRLRGYREDMKNLDVDDLDYYL